ncbi:MarR family winged helix-turn-helix transcriptional regulator [Corynebacterium sp. A21]|uniref:MarR family winged helix-turn-helix transcriptional regulator n=1 Tax=Corynebacterium sp. A21 TaxID=3457318 RepID=UPI003FD029C0
MSNDPIEALEYEAMIFGRHQAAFSGRANRSSGELDQSAYILLTLLQVRGALSISELSDTTGLDTSTLNRQTKALVDKGLAKRISDPDGGIARKFRPTAEGTTTLEKERSASITKLGETLEDWSTEDLTELLRLLGRMNLAVEKRSQRSWPRP